MADIINIVPQPGMPDLNFSLAPVVNAVAPLLSDSLAALAALGPQPWGIYQGGVPVILADTVLDLGYVKGYAISDYPIEDGGFASYDKVELPYEARVRFASGGSPDARGALLSSVEGIVGDLNLYDVVTPDEVYINANLIRHEYRRTQSDGGASLLQIDVALQEIRILASASQSNTQDPASANPQNGGTVQAQDYPVTTPKPTISGGYSGIPVSVSGGSGGIGSA